MPEGDLNWEIIQGRLKGEEEIDNGSYPRLFPLKVAFEAIVNFFLPL